MWLTPSPAVLLLRAVSCPASCRNTQAFVGFVTGPSWLGSCSGFTLKPAIRASLFISLLLPVQDLSSVVTLPHCSVTYPGGNCFVSKLVEIHPEQESYLISHHHVSEVLCGHPWGLARDLLEVCGAEGQAGGAAGGAGLHPLQPQGKLARDVLPKHFLCLPRTVFFGLFLSFLLSGRLIQALGAS